MFSVESMGGRGYRQRGSDPLVSAARSRLVDLWLPPPTPNIPTSLNREPEGEISACDDPALRCGLSVLDHSESAHLLMHSECQRSCRPPWTPSCFIIEMWSPREVPLHVFVTLFVVAAPVCSRFQMRGKRLCLFWSWHAAPTSSVIKF